MKQPLKKCKVWVKYNWDAKDKSYRKERLIGWTIIPFRVVDGALSEEHSWDVVEELLADDDYRRIASGPIKDTMDFLNTLDQGLYRVTIGTPESDWIFGGTAQWFQFVDDFEIAEFDQQNLDPRLPADDYALDMRIIAMGAHDKFYEELRSK